MFFAGKSNNRVQFPRGYAPVSGLRRIGQAEAYVLAAVIASDPSRLFVSFYFFIALNKFFLTTAQMCSKMPMEPLV
jgi:hypothetical protein